MLLRLAGWEEHSLESLPAKPWSLVGRAAAVTARVGAAAEAAAVVEAAARGAALAVHAATAELRTLVVDDLFRLGSAQLWDAERLPPAGRLDEDQIRLLRAVVAGTSVSVAAREVNVSRRTADRRLAEVRLRLGVGSNAEAAVQVGAQLDGLAPRA